MCIKLYGGVKMKYILSQLKDENYLSGAVVGLLIGYFVTGQYKNSIMLQVSSLLLTVMLSIALLSVYIMYMKPKEAE